MEAGEMGLYVIIVLASGVWLLHVLGVKQGKDSATRKLHQALCRGLTAGREVS